MNQSKQLISTTLLGLFVGNTRCSIDTNQICITPHVVAIASY